MNELIEISYETNTKTKNIMRKYLHSLFAKINNL